MRARQGVSTLQHAGMPPRRMHMAIAAAVAAAAVDWR